MLPKPSLLLKPQLKRAPLLVLLNQVLNNNNKLAVSQVNKKSH